MWTPSAMRLKCGFAPYEHAAGGRRFVDMDDEAKQLFSAERDRLRKVVQGCESLSDGFAAHVGKHPGMLARVALTFHAVCSALHPASRRLDGKTMALAIRFMRKAFRHSAALYLDILGGGTGMALARDVARTVLADGVLRDGTARADPQVPGLPKGRGSRARRRDGNP